MHGLVIGLTVAGCCAFSTVALAAGVATVHTGDRTVTVSFDAGNARVDLPGANAGYLLLRGDKVYSVVSLNGQPLVLDAQNAAGLLAGQSLQTKPDMIASLTRLSATGAHRSVAGLTGDVYTVAYRDIQGRAHTGEGVLGAQPQVRELTQVMGHLAVLLLAASHQPQGGTQQVIDALAQRGLGLLAYGTQYRVERLSSAPPAPGALDLPAAPAQLPGNLGQLLQGLSPQPK